MTVDEAFQAIMRCKAIYENGDEHDETQYDLMDAVKALDQAMRRGEPLPKVWMKNRSTEGKT